MWCSNDMFHYMFKPEFKQYHINVTIFPINLFKSPVGRREMHTPRHSFSLFSQLEFLAPARPILVMCLLRGVLR